MTRRMIDARDPEWPARLNELGPMQPPRLLHVEGRQIPPAEKSIAIVGTRRATATGLEAARRFARAFAESGFAVVSGLALGIDGAAHQGALEVDGHTVAVLGSGLDIAYPQRHADLLDRIRVVGTVVTEQPEGALPLARHFPARNRIIVGLSTAVVVIEGGLKSGALITARLGVDANRDVFAYPGSPRNAVAAGPNELIRTGQAALVTDPQQVFDELAPGLVWTEGYRPDGVSELHDDECEVLFSLETAPASMDQVCRATGFPAGRVSLALAKLELRGLCARNRGGGFMVSEAGARTSEALLGEQ